LCAALKSRQTLAVFGQTLARRLLEDLMSGMAIMPFASILSPVDILVIVVLFLLIFGPGKLADLGKGLGEGIKNFKSSVTENKEDAEKK
jgi:sec-independent protein translocase protein TatA